MRSQQLNGAAAILLLSFVAGATAMHVFKGPCPKNMTSIGNLDVERYLGKWYSYSVYTSGKMARCMSNDFKREGNTTNYTLIKKHISAFTDTLKVKIYQINYFDAAIGKFELQTQKNAVAKSLEVHILDTDYDNFAIQFMCIDVNEVFNMQWAGILTRQRIPTSETVFAAQKLARLSGIKTGLMTKVLQTACPPDA